MPERNRTCCDLQTRSFLRTVIGIKAVAGMELLLTLRRFGFGNFCSSVSR
jgi:hypothetical protein